MFGLKPARILEGFRGPFDFAQGRLLKRRSSTVLHAFVSLPASPSEVASRAKDSNGDPREIPPSA
jgi:hypothetical protein